MAERLLELKAVETAYGASQVLFGIDLAIDTGEVVTLLGRNGMGKTTTVRSIMGLVRPFNGSIRFQDAELVGLPSYKVAQQGVGLVPEGRQIFPNLSVRENLIAAAANRFGAPDPWTLEKIYALFPRLSERSRNMGNQLSGGEQQMLAVGRALMTNPKLLILDEATEGLAPLIREEIWSCILRIKAVGQAILLIDKNLDNLLEIGDRHYILEKGKVVWSGNSDTLADDEALQTEYLSL